MDLLEGLEHGGGDADHLFDLVALAAQGLVHAAVFVLDAFGRGGDAAVQHQRLAHERGHHAQQAQVVGEDAALFGVEAVDHEHAQRAVVGSDGRGEHGHGNARALIGAAGPVEEQGLGAHVGHGGGHAAGEDAAHDAFARFEAQALLFGLREAQGAQAVELAFRVGHDDEGAAPVEGVDEVVERFAEGLVDVQRGGQRFTDFVNRVQLAPDHDR
ncbi:hypothetical protein D9M69_494070 [compost metagenome]